MNWNIDLSFAPRPPISRAIDPSGTSARARTSLTAKVKPRGGVSKATSTLPIWSSFSGRSVTVIAFSRWVSVIEAESERWGRISSAASSTRLCLST